MTQAEQSDNWKIDNETFRRLARTGEFAPVPPEPELPAEDKPVQHELAGRPAQRSADAPTQIKEK